MFRAFEAITPLLDWPQGAGDANTGMNCQEFEYGCDINRDWGYIGTFGQQQFVYQPWQA
jgi:hypothetical protein